MKLALAIPHISVDVFPRFICRIFDVAHIRIAWRDAVECHEYLKQRGAPVKNHAHVQLNEGGIQVCLPCAHW